MTQVLAATRYALTLLLRSQRFFAPMVVFVLGVVVLTANDTGPVMGSFGACAFVLFPVALWLTVALVGAEDDVAHSVTVVNAGGAGRVLAGTVAVAVIAVTVGVVFGLVVPVAIGDHVDASRTAWLAGAAAELAAGMTGVAGGLLCSRLVVHRPAVSLCLSLALLAVVVAVPFSPVRELARLTESGRRAVDLVAPMLLSLGGAAVLALTAAAVALAVSQRRA